MSTEQVTSTLHDGVLTLTAYLRAENRWEGPDYRPQPGDMVIYDEPSPKGQHVNLVLVDDDGTLTTIGGGEGRGMPTPSLDRMAAEGMGAISPDRGAAFFLSELKGRHSRRSGQFAEDLCGQ